MANEILETCHLLVASRVEKGSTVVDATAGNGHDTHFLARLVGKEGVVHAFDIQQTALDSTRRRLKAANLASRVRLHQRDHAEMAAVIAGPVQAVMFNLGYLPGGNKDIVTEHHTTLRALSTALLLLAPGGVLSLVTYSGHDEGSEEAAVCQWCQQLPAAHPVLSVSLCNRPQRPPKLWFITKRC